MMQHQLDEDRRLICAGFDALSDDSAEGELEAACLISRVLNREADLTSIRQRVAELCSGCDSPALPWLYLRAQGYGRQSTETVNPSSSCLDAVLTTKTGLPIALGVLLIVLARSQGHDSWGVNFPGHFLVRVGKNLIDPQQMSEISETDCLARLPRAQRSTAMAKASPRRIALRMLNNLKIQYAGMARWDLALDIVEFQLALLPSELSLLLERGEYWLRLGSLDAARTALQAALDAAPADSDIARRAREQLTSIAGRHDTRH